MRLPGRPQSTSSMAKLGIVYFRQGLCSLTDPHLNLSSNPCYLCDPNQVTPPAVVRFLGCKTKLENSINFIKTHMNINQGNTQKARTVTAWPVGKAIMIKKKSDNKLPLRITRYGLSEASREKCIGGKDRSKSDALHAVENEESLL